MSDRFRVLIVEDHPAILESYVENIADQLGYAVDVARTRSEAIERVRQKSYHAALIDINLTDFSGEGGDRSGIEVLRALKATGEGTNCIVVSAEKSAEVPVDAAEIGYYKYVIKNRIVSAESYIPIVKSAVTDCKLNLFGKFADLGAYLSRPKERFDWDSQMMGALMCDAKTLNNVLRSTFDAVLPVLKPKGAVGSFSISSTGGIVQGTFWSRALGSSIEVFIGRKGANLPSFDSPFQVAQYSRGPVNYSIGILSNLQRSEFHDDASKVV